jgi:hypothetical protein
MEWSAVEKRGNASPAAAREGAATGKSATRTWIRQTAALCARKSFASGAPRMAALNIESWGGCPHVSVLTSISTLLPFATCSPTRSNPSLR